MKNTINNQIAQIERAKWIGKLERQEPQRLILDRSLGLEADRHLVVWFNCERNLEILRKHSSGEIVEAYIIGAGILPNSYEKVEVKYA